jgi:uncharacterized protein (DUF2344 family)
MNYSTAIFLINKNARAIRASYENVAGGATYDGAKYVFKTLDPDIAVDDYIVVPTETRHLMTVVKVAEVDVDLDLESSQEIKWVVGKINVEAYEELLKQEQQAIKKIKSAVMRKKRSELAEDLFTDNLEEIKALPISEINDDEKAD